MILWRAHNTVYLIPFILHLAIIQSKVSPSSKLYFYMSSLVSTKNLHSALLVFFVVDLASGASTTGSSEYISPLAKSSGITIQYYFALVFIPLLILGIFSVKKIQKNLLPLFVVSIILFFSLSILPVYRSYNFLVLLIPFSILNSIFIYEILPKFVYRLKNLQEERK